MLFLSSILNAIVRDAIEMYVGSNRSSKSGRSKKKIKILSKQKLLLICRCDLRFERDKGF